MLSDHRVTTGKFVDLLHEPIERRADLGPAIGKCLEGGRRVGRNRGIFGADRAAQRGDKRLRIGGNLAERSDVTGVWFGCFACKRCEIAEALLNRLHVSLDVRQGSLGLGCCIGILGDAALRRQFRDFLA